MHVLSPTERERRRPQPRRVALLAGAGLGLLLLAAPAQGACPWLVQPQPAAAKSPQLPVFEIAFDGLAQETSALYGFSVASVDVAWQLAAQMGLPDLEKDGRPLQPVESRAGTTAYRLAPDTIEPHTIYLVAARAPVAELEHIGARIEPARPVAVSEVWNRTRGASDISGPLPHLSLPGFEIAELADEGTEGMQICAYQVALR